MTPSELIAKYGVNDPDVKKRLREIGLDISSVALNGLGIGQSLSDGVLQGFKITGNKMKIEAIGMGSKSISKQSLSRVGKRARALEGVGEDLEGVSKAIGDNKIWKGMGIVGTVAGTAIDYNDQMEKYDDEQRAIKNTIAHTAIEAGGAAIGGQIGAVIGTAIPIPVVGTVVGAGAGIIIGTVGSKIYDWVESGNAKKDFDKHAQGISEGFNDVKKNTTKWFSSVGKSLGGAFN